MRTVRLRVSRYLLAPPLHVPCLFVQLLVGEDAALRHHLPILMVCEVS